MSTNEIFSLGMKTKVCDKNWSHSKNLGENLSGVIELNLICGFNFSLNEEEKRYVGSATKKILPLTDRC